MILPEVKIRQTKHAIFKSKILSINTIRDLNICNFVPTIRVIDIVILLLTYEKPLTEVDKYLEEHRNYLDNNYKAGNFLASGKRNPRTGGVILVKGTREKAETPLEDDPFYIHKIARYDIIEFEPAKPAPGLENFLQ